MDQKPAWPSQHGLKQSMLIGCPLVCGGLALVALQFELISAPLAALGPAIVTAALLFGWQRHHSQNRPKDVVDMDREKYRLLAEALPGLVWVLDRNGRMEFVNQQWIEYTGFDVQQTNDDQGWAKIVHPDDLPGAIRQWEQVRASGGTYEAEARYRRRDGVYRWFLGRVTPFRDDDQQAILWAGSSIDIEDQKQSMDALRRSERRYRALAQATPQLVWIAGGDGTGNSLHAWWEATTGQTPEQAAGWGWLEVLHPDDRDRTREAWTRALETQQFFHIEYRLRSHHGDYLDFDVHAVALFDEQGQFEEWVGTLTDITPRKRGQEALRASEARFRQLADAMPQIVWTARHDGIVDYCNQRWHEFSGQPAGESGWFLTLHDEDVEPCKSAWYECVGSGVPFEREVRFKDRRTGGHRWHLARALPIRDPIGGFRWFGTCTDIHDQKLTEEALHRARAELEHRVAERTEELAAANRDLRSEIAERLRKEISLRQGEERYRSLVAATTAIVWATPASGEFESEQPGWSAFTGQSFDELKGWGWLQAIHPDDQPNTARVWSHSVASRCLYQVEHRLRRHDGEYRYMLVRAVPIVEEDGTIREWIGVHTDVTEQRCAENAMREARDAAETANRAKSEFLANMSHEIRTPMNGILGMTDLVLDSILTADQRECLGAVKNSAEALLGLINDVLDFSKIEAGKLELVTETFVIRERLDDLLMPLAVRGRLRGLTVTCNVHPDVPIALTGDLGRLRQVILNLAGNAVKFTERGGVTVTVECVGERMADSCVLQFSVRDTGIGIPTGKMKSIFAPFEQADGSMARRYGGTGLGLTISARLVELMGGSISVESVVGVGSVFRFTVRMTCCEVADARAPTPKPAPPARPLRILMAEDNQVNQRVGTKMLERQGHSVVVASNGKEALAALEREPFDLILMDVQMPEMDGLETTAHIRAAEHDTGRHIPVIALTAHAMKGDRERFLAAGMDGYVTKPIEAVALREAIEESLKFKVQSSKIMQAADECLPGVKSEPSATAEEPPSLASVDC